MDDIQDELSGIEVQTFEIEDILGIEGSLLASVEVPTAPFSSCFISSTSCSTSS